MATDVKVIGQEIEALVMELAPDATVEVLDTDGLSLTIRVSLAAESTSRALADKDLEGDPTVQRLAAREKVTPRQYLARLRASEEKVQMRRLHRANRLVRTA